VLPIVRSCVLAGVVWAQAGGAVTDGTALVERGVELRLAGNEAQALALFHEAEKIERTPRLLAQMALAEQSLGHWRDAEVHLREALARKDDVWIAKQRAALEDALAIIERHLGTLELLGGDGGDVLVDGRPEGKLPRERPLRLEVGRHRVEVRKEGAFAFVRDVEIMSETNARETVTLLPIPRDADGAQHGSEATAPGTRAPQSSPHRVLGWSLIGGAGAGGVVGVVSLLTSNGHAHDYNADASCTGRPGQSEACSSNASAARDWRAVSIASFAIAGALAIGGVIVLWRSPATSARLQLVPGPRSAEVGLSGSF
jgi:hypothetical protein